MNKEIMRIVSALMMILAMCCVFAGIQMKDVLHILTNSLLTLTWLMVYMENREEK